MKFIDPRIDFAFRKIFGSEETKEVLKSFVEAVLGLEGDKKLKEIHIADPYQLPKLQLLKITILDVKCTDHRGITYLVEMQIKRTEAFLKRVQYNLAKSYSGQITSGADFPKLNQVIGITITDFTLFPRFSHYHSCHTTRETLTNEEYLSDIVYYFLELSKFDKKEKELVNSIDKWSYFLKMAGELEEIPEALKEPPYKTAFEVAMVSRMTRDEYELYDNAAMQITDHKGSLEFAHKEGFQEGMEKGKEEGREKGREEGMEKGMERKSVEIANNLIKLNMPLEQISQVTGLPIEEIEKLIQSN